MCSLVLNTARNGLWSWNCFTRIVCVFTNKASLRRFISSYNKCFFGYAKYSSMTEAFVQTGLPTGDTIVINCKFRFHKQLTSFCNRLVKMFVQIVFYFAFHDFFLLSFYLLFLCVYWMAVLCSGFSSSSNRVPASVCMTVIVLWVSSWNKLIDCIDLWCGHDGQSRFEGSPRVSCPPRVPKTSVSQSTYLTSRFLHQNYLRTKNPKDLEASEDHSLGETWQRSTSCCKLSTHITPERMLGL